MHPVGSWFGEDLHVCPAVPPLGGVNRRSGNTHGLNKIRLGRQVHYSVTRCAHRDAAVDIVLVVLLPLSGCVDLVSRLLLKTIVVRGTGTKRASSRQPRTRDAG